MLLETPRRNSWTDHKRGELATVLSYMQSDTEGTFHGLGSLVASERDPNPSVQRILHRDFEIPIHVLAEPEHWYALHRKPSIVEVSEAADSVLVRFVAQGMSGSFHGSCLYAQKDTEWGCYTIKPNASDTIASAELWLDKRGWEDWG